MDPFSEPISKLSDAVINVANTTANFNPELKQLKETLNRIIPTFDDINRLNRILDRPRSESDKFVDLIEDAKKLVFKCSKIKINPYKKFTHSLKLKELNENLLRFFQIEVQENQIKDIKQILAEVSYVRERMTSLELNIKNRDDKLSSGPMSMSWGRYETLERHKLGWAVPPPPKGVVAFDDPLKMLKAKVLVGIDDGYDDGSLMDCDGGFGNVVVVSAAGRCGKTTLVKMLCNDTQIQDKFGENIFFVTVSKKPHFMVMVNDLLNPDSFGQTVPFQSNEDAKNKLENFFSAKASGPILVVLDDVWSDSFIKNFEFGIKRYKLLVTSRMVFPKYDVFKFDPLSDENEDAKILVHHLPRPSPTIDENLVNQSSVQSVGPLLLPLPGNINESEPSTSSIDRSQPCRRFELPEILLATNDFDESSVIGRGGFGKVYRGTVFDESGTLVDAAIKRLDSMSNQGAPEFWAEVEMLSKLRHCHLVSLIGYCNQENEMILVYEYLPLGTLADHLHKLGTSISWIQRLRILIGAARGLDYLHTGAGIEFGIMHRDVKTSNILLHKSWSAKISDFGLSRIGPKNQLTTHVSTLVKGTFGYLDPNYFHTGNLTRKSDVYAFGVVLFEVLCRKRAVIGSLDEEQLGLAPWAQESIKEGKLKQIIDSDIRSEISQKCLKEFVGIAERCLHTNPKNRPTMAEVVFSLESVLSLQEKINKSLETAGKTIFGRLRDILPSIADGAN